MGRFAASSGEGAPDKGQGKDTREPWLHVSVSVGSDNGKRKEWEFELPRRQ